MNIPLHREFRLSNNKNSGVRCDADGAFVGAVPLLKQAGDAWAPREDDALSASLSNVYGLPVDVSPKRKALSAIARALNKSDLARAQVTTLLLRLPDPLPLAKGAPSRDRIVKLAIDLHRAGMLKIDDLHYPGGTPDDKGGEFAPKNDPLQDFANQGQPSDSLDIRQIVDDAAKNPPQQPTDAGNDSDVSDSTVGDRDTLRGSGGGASDAAEEIAERAGKKVALKVIRRAFRRAISKFALEALGKSYKLIFDEIPIVGYISDIFTARDIFQLGAEFRGIQVAAKAAKEFVDLGPRRIQELFVDDQEISFANYGMFLKLDLAQWFRHDLAKRYGSAGPGMSYHHIIEQSSGLPKSITENTHNIVRIPDLLHEEISAVYATKSARWGGQSLHDWLKGKSPWVQRYWGYRIMYEQGAARP